jgi:hypothetical protein
MDLSGRTVFLLFAAATLVSSCASLPSREGVRPTLPSSREILARGIAEFDAADAVRRERSPMPVMGGVFNWPPDAEKWERHLRNAEDDFWEILGRFPASPEAAEAQFMLGRINDHPHLNRFDVALVEYRRTVERYPGTPAAEKARQRIEVIESIKK